MTLLRRLGGVPGDRGAIAAMVAVLLGGGALLGMGALTIDVGLLYAEREELQTGADAAAVAVAKRCVAGTNLCSSTAGSLARGYADDNAHDGASSAAVCGYAPNLPDSGNLLSPCGSGGGFTDCLGDVPSSQPHVEVHTATRSGGGGVLPPVFAQTVTGTTGTQVHACARVTWGPIEEVDDALGLAIAEAEFKKAIDSGNGFQPAPRGAGTVNPDSEIALRFRTPNCRDADVPGGPGGPGGPGDPDDPRDPRDPDDPRDPRDPRDRDPDAGCPSRGALGGFGFLTDGECTLDIRVDRSRDGEERTRVPAGCGERMHHLHHAKEVTPVAIFDGASSDRFHIVGIAMFMITGWHSPTDWPGRGDLDHDHGPEYRGALACTGTRVFCVYGYFTTRVFQVGPRETLGKNHYGAVHIRTIG